jgi:subtilisin family serine protease
MKNQRHVILRAVGTRVRSDGFRGGPGASPLESTPTGIALDIDELDRGKAAEVSRSRDVLAVAPVMPMRLIEPRVSSGGAQALAAGPDWGITAVGADTSPFTGDGIVVAVLDTGIDSSHPAFAGVELVQQNFTADPNGADTHGHGTHCAGTIFGRDVAGKRIGVARGVRRAFIGKVLGSGGGGSGDIVRAIQWAVEGGANVISMSLGMDFPGFQKFLEDEHGFPPELATSRALEGYRANVLLFERLASTIRAMGALGRTSIIVAAAGNESRSDEDPDFKIAVSPPAVSEGILSVAALGQSPAGLVVAPFSNTGSIMAGPGVAITSAAIGGGLKTMSGTSMATPHVAGVAALWAQKLSTMGSLDSGRLFTKVVASGTVAPLKAGFDPGDVGTGLVRAPAS